MGRAVILDMLIRLILNFVPFVLRLIPLGLLFLALAILFLLHNFSS